MIKQEVVVADSALKRGHAVGDILHAPRNAVDLFEQDEGMPLHGRPTKIFQVMTMPRSTEEILAQADELAREFEEYDPKPGDRERVSPEFRLRIAALKRAEAEAEVAAAVTEARRKQISWAKIGASLGTTGQSARERYSKLGAGAKKRTTSGAVRKPGGKTTRRARRPNRTGEPNERTKAG